MNWPALIVGLVALERLAELGLARRNERALRLKGGVEIGRGHYPFLVLLHLSWLIAIYAAAPRGEPPLWAWIAAFLALQAARLWVIASLGGYWTTRVITVPREPLVRRGPYRFLRHPNYAVVVGEIAVLPLAFGEGAIAAIFSALNLVLLGWRIRLEGRALAPRR